MNIVKKIPFPAVLAKIKMKNIFIFISALTIITPTTSPTVSENYLDLFAKQDKSQEINSQSNSVMADNTTGNINNGETIDYNYPPASSLTLYIANAEKVISKMLTNKMLTSFVETDPDSNDLVMIPLKLQCSTLKALTSFVETDPDANDLVVVPLKLQCSTLKALTSFVETDLDTNDLVMVPLKLQCSILKALTSFVETDPDTNDLVVVPLKHKVT